MLHVLKFDGVSDLLGMSERDPMVSFVYLYFYWPVLSLEGASVLGQFLHGTQLLCVSLSFVPAFCLLSDLSPCSHGHIWI